MVSRMWLRLAGIFVIALFCWGLFAGCSMGPEQADQTSDDSFSQSDGSLLSSDDTVRRFLAPSVLVTFLIEAGVNEGSYTSLFLNFEDSIALCMKDQGFEYYPSPPPVDLSPIEESPQGLQSSLIRYTIDVSYQSDHGYGIVDDFLERNAHESGNAHESTEPLLPSSDTLDYENPYEAYFLTLSEEAAEEWFVALDECLEKTILAFPFDTIAHTDAISNLEYRMATDERIRAAQDSWSDCMTGAGYRVDEMSDIYDLLIEHADHVAGKFGFNLSDVVAGLDLGFFDVEQFEAVTASARKFEIDIARQDLECYGDVAPNLDVAIQEIEQEVLDENRTLFESYAQAFHGE